jgi:hypothetical protein
LSHCFDMLHCFCSAALLWYATLLLFCYIALICYIVTLLLFHYILIYMNTYYIAQWQKWAKWDECGNMDKHYCTIKISSSNNMYQIGIRLSSGFSQSRWSFLLLLCHHSVCKAFFDDRSNNTTLYFLSAFFTESRTTIYGLSWRRYLERRSIKASFELT